MCRRELRRRVMAITQCANVGAVIASAAHDLNRMEGLRDEPMTVAKCPCELSCGSPRARRPPPAGLSHLVALSNLRAFARPHRRGSAFCDSPFWLAALRHPPRGGPPRGRPASPLPPAPQSPPPP